MATYVDPYAQKQLNQPTSINTKGGSGSAGSGTETTVSSRSGTSASDTQNIDPASLAALQTLIAQLAGGGTAQMRADRAIKNEEIGTLQTNRLGYSKEAAFSDAQGLMAQTMRQALEKLLPSINTGALGAGSSQSSMRALLTQRAGENAAEAASAQGLTAAINYGNVSNSISNILASLLNSQDPATAALINALNVAKGSTQQINSSTSESGTSTRNIADSKTGTSSENKNIGYGGITPSQAEQAATPGFSYFGPVAGNTGGNTEGRSGIPYDVLAELASRGSYSNNGSSNYGDDFEI